MINLSRKLYIRVALSIAIVAVAVSLLSSTLSYYSGLKEKKHINYLLVQQLTETMAKTGAISAQLNDRKLGQEVVNGLLSNDLVQGVSLEIVNNNGEIEQFISSGMVNKKKRELLLNCSTLLLAI